MKKIIFLISIFMLSGCKVGPEYKRPEIKDIPVSFVNGDMKWKEAQPNSDIDHGQWWKIYDDKVLNELQDQLDKKNLDIVGSLHSYKASLALVNEARASYFPSIGAEYDVTRQASQSTTNNKTEVKLSSSHSLALSASWQLDLWNSIGYAVEANKYSAEAARANLASTKLSMQSSLAQYYFEFISTVLDQKLLDEVVTSNKQIVDYQKNRYKAGIVDDTIVSTAENNYFTAKSQAESNRALIVQYRNAIAVLLGSQPTNFTLLVPKDYHNKDIVVPMVIPSSLLERRPDIAAAEKLVAEANANIGEAKTAYFPSISLAPTATYSGAGIGSLLSMPTLLWSIGPQLGLSLIDGGLRSAKVSYASETYLANVASYQKTVLSAFSDVENQLSSLKSLITQQKMQQNTVKNTSKMYHILQKQYKAGTADLEAVLNQKIADLNARKSLYDTITLKRSGEIALIASLGGGWN